MKQSEKILKDITFSGLLLLLDGVTSLTWLPD